MEVRTNPLVWLELTLYDHARHDAELRLVYNRQVDAHAPPAIVISRAAFFGSGRKVIIDPQLQRVQLLRRSERDIRRRRFSIAYGSRKKLVRFRATDVDTYDTWRGWLEFALHRFELHQRRVARRGLRAQGSKA
ncbi:hypothetical protein BBJ28_00019941 [Nothophytophthora sp. Chile5]|nr:hypothetical protein BBJ28_00019941 [Nothophytophthora sp. Chile5]